MSFLCRYLLPSNFFSTLFFSFFFIVYTYIFFLVGLFISIVIWDALQSKEGIKELSRVEWALS